MCLFVYNSIFAIRASTAELVATFTIQGAMNCDWEDLAVGPGPYAQSYIYIGDVGWNGRRVACRTVYRVKEPPQLRDAQLPLHGELHYEWDDINCETIMVDQTAALYLVTKVPKHNASTIYRIPSFAGRYKKVTLTNGKSQQKLLSKSKGISCIINQRHSPLWRFNVRANSKLVTAFK